jgi:putative addiction module killer protein
VITVQSTRTFDKWLLRLKDFETKQRINARISRLMHGYPGDEKALGHGVRELRIHVGPGYRLYYVKRGDRLIVLLCGGNKSSQESDIRTAMALAKGEFQDG